MRLHLLWFELYLNLVHHLLRLWRLVICIEIDLRNHRAFWGLLCHSVYLDYPFILWLDLFVIFLLLFQFWRFKPIEIDDVGFGGDWVGLALARGL